MAFPILLSNKDFIKFESTLILSHFLSGSSTRQLILRALDSFFEDLIGSWIWKTSKILDEDLWQSICEKVDILIDK
jgi:hypothetical protein